MPSEAQKACIVNAYTKLKQLERAHALPRVLISAGTGVGKSRIMKCVPALHLHDKTEIELAEEVMTTVYVIFINQEMLDRDLYEFEEFAIKEEFRAKHGEVLAFTSLTDCTVAHAAKGEHEAIFLIDELDEWLFGDDEPLEKPGKFMDFLQQTVKQSRLVGLSATVFCDDAKLTAMERVMYSYFNLEHIKYSNDETFQTGVRKSMTTSNMTLADRIKTSAEIGPVFYWCTDI
jgi:hypothetical protein